MRTGQGMVTDMYSTPQMYYYPASRGKNVVVIHVLDEPDTLQ